DGAVDETMRRCSTGRREQNEPSVAVDPRHPNIVAMGANDYCAAITTGDAWVGFYRSTDGGRTWVDGLVPGYPTDTSFAGRASAAHGRCIAASDPTLAFDRAGRLFFGFICFGRLEGGRRGVVGSSTLIATYDHDGSRYVRTILVSRGTPDRNEDKINLTVDQSRGRYGGNVYAAWVQLAKPTKQGYPQDPLLFARSTDHGATFSRPAPVSALVHSRFPDMAVGPDATVYVGFRSGDTLWVASSTNGGRSFRNPVQVAGTIVPFDSGQFTAGSPRDDCGVGRYRCHSHLIFSRFDTQIVVCADEAGVHVAWNERVGEGQSKVMIRNSRDGVTWSPAQQIDHIGAGHQYFPDITSGGGVITLVFYDSRNDPAYAPTLPPGDTAAGKSSGGAVDVYAAQSLDGGLAWTERRVTNHSSNLNFMTPSSVPFWGDYIYVSAAGRHVQVAWTDSRDFVTRKKGSFLPYRPCGSRQYVNDPCVSEGGSDENVYTARL
ncbi:MAG TPA: sialidase family protein, partial [Actinomycetota bacterium]